MKSALRLVIILLACSACRGMQETPTAPSPVVPAPAPSPSPAPPSTPFAVALEIVRPPQTNPTMVSWQALVTVTPTPGTVSPPLPASVQLDCGTGGVQRREGFFGTDAFTCISPNDGTFQTRAIATGAGGFSAQATASVTVARNVPPFNIELQTSGPGEVMEVGDGYGRRVTYSVLVTPDARLAQSFEFDFGDGTKSGDVNHFQQSHVYTKSGTYTMIVSVKSTDGRHLKAAKMVDIVLP